jgi:hypothetical protein
MPDEYVQTGTYTESICRIEYDYNSSISVYCKFCAENGDVLLEKECHRGFVTELKLRGWNSRSRGIQGFVLETWDLDNAYPIEVPVMTRVPDEDVLTGGLYVDERPL